MPPATHLGGRVPRRVDAATKTALLELLERAVEQGWSVLFESPTIAEMAAMIDASVAAIS